jgi:hypothetical protein
MIVIQVIKKATWSAKFEWMARMNGVP